MNDYLLVFLRIISIMALLLCCTLAIMGKRPIGELPVFDFLSIIVIGSIVGADIADPEIKHLPTAFAIVLMAVIQKVISMISVRSKKFRKLINFEPTVVLCDGQLLHKNIKRISYTVDEVLMLLRQKDIFDLNKASYAIVEQNGNLSVLKRSEHDMLTPQQMNMKTPEISLHTIIIFEGKLQTNNLSKTSFTEKDIEDKIQQQGYRTMEEVFFASIDKNGVMNLSPYQHADIRIDS